MGRGDETGPVSGDDTGLGSGDKIGLERGDELEPGSEVETGREDDEMGTGVEAGTEAVVSGGGLCSSLSRGLTSVGRGPRAGPSEGVGSRPEGSAGRGVSSAGSPELEGRGGGASWGEGPNPSLGAWRTTIFTTPELFTMAGGICSGRGCPTASWRTWAPVKVNLLPWIWKVRGLLPPELATGRCAKEANCPMLTTSPEGRRACMSGERMRR